MTEGLTKEEKEMINYFMVNHPKIIVKKYKQKTVKNLTEEDFKHKFQIVQSKNNKDGLVIDLLKQIPEESRFLVIGDDRLIDKYNQSFLKTEKYDPNKDNDRVVVGLNRVFEIKNTEEKWYNVIIINECGKFFASILKNQNNLLFVNVLRDARYVIFLDTQIGKGLFKFIQMVDDECTIVHHHNR